MTVLASVVIPARNVADTIGDQLDALARQDFPTDHDGATRFEVLVCDNGSTDTTAETVRTRIPMVPYDLRVIDASAVVGAAHARNVGADVARGELLVFCDGDDRVHPGWVTAMVAALQDADVVSGALETETLNSELVRSWRFAPSRDEASYWPGFLALTTGANFGVRTGAYRSVGGCDETYVDSGEDTDLAFRLQLAGFVHGHTSDGLVAYRLRSDLSGLWWQSVRCGRANVRLFDEYRRYGMPRRSIITSIDVALLILLRNPLLPNVITRLARGRWVFFAGDLAGRIQESCRRRVYCL